MRNLAIFICLAPGLTAGEPAQPGRDLTFIKRIQPYLEGAAPPKRIVQKSEASAVVEVIGEYSREQRRQIVFQEFQSWFREDLRAFWLSHSDMTSGLPSSSGAMASMRSGGNAAPTMAPLFSKGF
jgi:hypothetical protein